MYDITNNTVLLFNRLKIFCGAKIYIEVKEKLNRTLLYIV